METEKRKDLARVIVEEVRPVLSGSESKTLLDYGSGTGLVSLELTDLVASLVLVDASKEVLEAALDKITTQELTNAKVLYSDFTKEMPEVKTDIVLLSLVLLHIPDTKLILRELYRILNDGGKLIIVDFDKNDQVNHPKIHSGFVHEELKNILSETGFKSTKIKTFHHGDKMFAKQDASMFISISKK